MPLPAAAAAIVVGTEIAVSTSALVLAAPAGAGMAALGSGAAVAAGTAGLAGAAAVVAPALIAVGAGFAIVTGGSYAGSLAANMTSEAAEWAAREIDPNDRENVRKVEKSMAFGTFAARAGTFEAKDTFKKKYPFDTQEAILQSPFDNNTETADGKRTNKARIVGFWAIFVRIKDYDQSKVSRWNHSLIRANFGSVAFCYNDVPVQESPIHFSHQIIPVPMVRALTADSILGDVTTSVTNTIHGYLAPSVEAEISFIPVYECTGWTWSKNKPP